MLAAVTLRRAANARLETGVWGEHGGDSASDRFFHRAGPDYVSCSPSPASKRGARRWRGVG